MQKLYTITFMTVDYILVKLQPFDALNMPTL